MCGIGEPSTIRLNIEHQKLRLFASLKVYHQELVLPQSWHFATLRSEVSAEDKASAN